MPYKATIAELQQQILEATEKLNNLEKGETTRLKYARFQLKTIIRKCQSQIRQQRSKNRAKNVKRYYQTKNNKPFVQKLYEELTFQDLGYISLEEVRQSSFTEAISRCRTIYKKEKISAAQAANIIRILDERTNHILGQDR